MIRKPNLPMTPIAVPRQRLVEVVTFPPWPDHARITDCLFWHPVNILPKRQPRCMHYLGAVEWAWHPLSSRADAYYLHRARRHWIVHIRDPDPNEPEDERMVAAYAPRCGVTAEEAAAHLIAARWCAEAEECGLDPFHFVSEEGDLSVADFRAIARMVWGVGEARQ